MGGDLCEAVRRWRRSCRGPVSARRGGRRAAGLSPDLPRESARFESHGCLIRGMGAVIFVLTVLCSRPTSRAQEHVADTVHNLSARGPGDLRAAVEPEVCIFCHASHSTTGASPLWNRELPPSSYKIYESSTLDAEPGQPTGTSKLCLSCHDGTIAIGSVLSRADRIRMVGGEYVPAGLANLGTNLADDHPVSFTYGTGIAAADRQLISPRALPAEIKLDADNQLECTACHDPHHNKYGNFLVVDNTFGALCTSCHAMEGWSAGAHRNAAAAVAGSRVGDWPYPSVAANACRSCHRSHTAGGHQRLMIFEAEEDNCLNCHDGTVAKTDVRAELDKLSAHDPRRYTGVHDPTEGAWPSQAHVECADCHNPHAARATSPAASRTSIGATLLHTAGVTSGGGGVDNAQAEYEVCLRCHGDTAASVAPRVSRQIQEFNMRQKFGPTSASFHPVITTSPSLDTVSLAPGLTRGAVIHCTDCHNNDSGPRAGGGGPDGPHGSIHESLLERNYTVRDDVSESEFEYALCYKCHQRSSILSNDSFPSHRQHIVNERTPCSACHDPHGISPIQGLGSDHTHLINFDTRIVRPDRANRRIEFRDHGRLAGSCTLECHGSEHNDRTYGMTMHPSTTRDSTRQRGRRRR